MDTYLEAIDALERKPDIVEIHHRTSFKCHRLLKDGGVQELIIYIFDRGKTSINPLFG